MDFRFSEESLAMQEELEAFFRTRVLPRNHEWQAHLAKHGVVPPFLEDLKREARAKGLWNLGLPDLKPDQPGTRLTNLEFAPLAAIMGRLPWAPIAFNCNAPNVPNMEILQKFGTAAQKRQWLDPLLDGKIWTAFGMTEPDVASSDARNIRTRIRRDGGDYVIDGRKWYITGAAHPDCKMVLVVGVTAPDGDAGRRHSGVLVPRETPGLEIVRTLPIFGRGEDAGGAPVELRLTGVRVPRENLLGEEGAGFAMGQARLGVARIHHCMRSLGSCDVLLQLMRERAANRKAFGRLIGDYANIQDYIALSRIEVEQAKLLVYKTAWLLDQGSADSRREISMIKVAVARCYSAIADRAVQIFGAAGVSDDTPISAAYTAARAMRIYDGPDEVHLRTLFRLEPHEVAGESRHYLRAD